MRNIISVILIDPEYKNHAVDKLGCIVSDFSEQKFDIRCLTDTNDLLKKLNAFRGVDSIISIGENIDFTPLNEMSFEFRKKWVHFDEFDAEKISASVIATFEYNISRERPKEVALFSIFTCTFNTTKKKLERLHDSLVGQTYPNWNWWILDDSKDNFTTDYIAKLNDPRIFVIKNVSNHGNIGYNKHIIASACDGDYLVEIDHDDELTSDCLEKIKEAFDTYDDADFVYSDTLEYIDETNQAIYYGNEYGFGEGKYRSEAVNGVEYNIAVSCPNINAKTIRTIYTQPNHVRCWKKDFYHKIGGHNMDLSVLDDMEILIRTFLYGKMAKVDKVLYIQHEGERGDTSTDNAQNKRFKEIQRVVWLLKEKYDKAIHERILELGAEDPIWDEDAQCSDIRTQVKGLVRFDYVIN